MTFSSKLALPWCATSGAEYTRRATAATKMPALVVLIDLSLFRMMREPS
jgi:hypothetical protein